MIKLHTHSEISIPDWQKLIANSASSSFFQTVACYDFYKSLSFLEPFVYAVSEQDELVGLVCGYMISDGGSVKKYFSRRAIVPGGLLLSKNISNDALEHLLQGLKSHLRHKAIYIEIRNYSDYSAYKSVFQLRGFDYQKHLNIQLATNLDAESVFGRLSESKQRQVKLSERAGVDCVKTKSNEDVKAFYLLLSALYKSKIRKPLFPIEFFEKIIACDFAKLFVVKKDNQVLGGILIVEFNNKAVYEWFICGDDKKVDSSYPSVLATWKAIEYANKNKFEYFDFMGAGKPDQDYGVRDFKAKFGGNLVEQGRFLYICNSFVYNIAKLYLNLFYNKK